MTADYNTKDEKEKRCNWLMTKDEMTAEEFSDSKNYFCLVKDFYTRCDGHDHDCPDYVSKNGTKGIRHY